MNLLRNRYLGTSSMLLAPADKPKDGVTEGQQDDGNGAVDTGVQGEDGDGTGADGDGASDDGDAAGDGGDDGAAGATAAEDDDEDPDLADLTPEQRKKVQARIDKETRWRDKQLNKLHAKNRTLEEDKTALETIADPARRPAAPKPGETLTEAEVERRAKIKAKEISASDKYDNDANAADAAGKKAYGDKWGTKLAKLPKLGGVDVSDMVNILATDQPHVVLFELSDPDTYDRVMSLPPAKRFSEFVKLSLKEAPKPKAAESKRPSDAEPPVRPISGGRRIAAQQVDLYNDKTDDDAWFAARNESRRKKFSNAQ